MDIRKITIVSTRDQKRTVVETDATTLSELKAALAAADVDYSGMTFYEALTRTEIMTDESLLPHDVAYKGTVTNELVFMLTNPNKKIKSGALSEARVALYDAIVEGGFAEAVSEKYGKNFTNCSNAELAAFLEEQAQPEATCVDTAARNAITRLVAILEYEDYLTYREGDEVRRMLADTPAAPVVASPYSEDELNAIVDGMSEFVR